MLAEDGKSVLQFFDALDNPISVPNHDLGSVALDFGKITDLVDVTDAAELDSQAGKVTLKYNSSLRLEKGSCKIYLTIMDKATDKQETLTVSNKVNLNTRISAKGFAY